MIDLNNIDAEAYGVYYRLPNTEKDVLQHLTYPTEHQAMDAILTFLPSDRKSLSIHPLLKMPDVKVVVNHLQVEISSLRVDLDEVLDVNQRLIDTVDQANNRIGVLEQYLHTGHPGNDGLQLLYSAANTLPACNLFAAIIGGIQDFQATQAQLDDARAEVKRLKDFEILYTKFRTDVIATMNKNGEVLDEQLFDQALAHKYLEGDVDG